MLSHGATARGVDWNSEASQQLRFEQLMRVLDQKTGPFSVNDFGCGYGALAAYLQERGFAFHYRGFDLSATMIEFARERYAHLNNCDFLTPPELLSPAEYTLASGIFNVKLTTDTEEWREYMLDTIDQLNGLSTRGFAFNVLTIHSDLERRRSDLFYEDPCYLFDYCRRRYSPWVALYHDYELYEFTVVVRKTSGS